MKKLQNILYQKEFNKDMSTISTDRKFQVHFAILTIMTRCTKRNYRVIFLTGPPPEFAVLAGKNLI